MFATGESTQNEVLVLLFDLAVIILTCIYVHVSINKELNDQKCFKKSTKVQIFVY